MSENSMTTSDSMANCMFPESLYLSIRLCEIQDTIDWLDKRIRDLVKRENIQTYNQKYKWLS